LIEFSEDRADVLIVGGGGAAARAAIEAHDAGAFVILATKRRLGAGGATGYPVAEFAGLAVADKCEDSTDTPDLHLEDILQSGMEMCDEELSRILTTEALQTIPNLENWGVTFERDKDDNYLITKGCFSSRARNYKLKDHGRKIITALTRQIQTRQIKVLEETMLVDIVTRDNEVIGAFLLQHDGTLVLVRTNAIVLGTGGAGQLFKFNMNPSDITGDGHAAGFRAGAKLVNMEFVQYGIGTVPELLLFPHWLWPFCPALKNSQGKEFLSDYLPKGVTEKMVMESHGAHYPFTNRLVSRYIELAIQKEIIAGRTSINGGIYADFIGKLDKQNLPDATEKLWRAICESYARRGFEITKKPIEIACHAHAMNGGLRVNKNGETRVQGLFAAGEVAGGPHGADRLGGGMLTACQVFGKRAGLAAAKRKRRCLADTPMDESIKLFSELIEGLKQSGKNGTHLVGDLRQELQENSSRNLMLVRNETGLKSYIKKLSEIETNLNMHAVIVSPEDLIAALELRNLLETGRIIANSALVRKETRGSHLREDYPITTEKAERLIVERTQEGTIQVCARPVGKNH